MEIGTVLDCDEGFPEGFMGRAGMGVGVMCVGREVRGGRVVAPSGDFVSLDKAGVGLGGVGRGGNGEGERVGRGGNREGERVGRDNVGILVSLKVEVVSPEYSMSFVKTVVGVGERGKEIEDVGLEGDDAGMEVAVESKVVVLGADEDVNCGRVSRDSVALGDIEEGRGMVVKDEEMEGGSMMTTSGDCVSLGNAGVGVGEMGRDWDTEEVRVGRDDVGTRVSVITKVVSSGSSVSLGWVGVVKMTPLEVCTSVEIVEVGIGQTGKATDDNEMLSA